MPAPKWTPATVKEIGEYFARLSDETTPGDGSYNDHLLQRLSNVFWKEQWFPGTTIIAKRSKGCRVA